MKALLEAKCLSLFVDCLTEDSDRLICLIALAQWYFSWLLAPLAISMADGAYTWKDFLLTLEHPIVTILHMARLDSLPM